MKQLRLSSSDYLYQLMVYIIHFDKPFKHALHYIGYCKDELFEKRMEHHRKGTGARLLNAVNKAGIGWSVVRTWPGEDGNFERKLKNASHSKRHCPICKENKNADNINSR